MSTYVRVTFCLAETEILSHGSTSLIPFFTAAESRQLSERRSQLQTDTATIVYCVYENPFGRSGGIFAVADNYSQAQVAAGRQFVVFTPLHLNLKTAPQPGELTLVDRCTVPLTDGDVPLEILEQQYHGVRWVYLKADGYFDTTGGAGKTDPYVHAVPTKLLTDSLFACAAIPPALHRLGLRDNLIIHAQDWELASVALTVKEAMLQQTLQRAAIVLTSHNPYDQALPVEALRRISTRSYGETEPETVYQNMMPLADAPITTVSKNFAQELTTDPLQNEYFANHLQDVFRATGLVGVDNGLFGSRNDPPFSPSATAACAAGRVDLILAEKQRKRQKMLDVLSTYEDERIWGRLAGDKRGSLNDLPLDLPIFLMFGRLDARQKGFDVLARAIESYPPGEAKFILTPIVGDTNDIFAKDLQELSRKRAGDVVVYPFRMERGYMEAMAGATFAIMPSFYEPFGGATEPYLAGTPVIARAVGGLTQQVNDLSANPEAATGLLYREQLPQESLGTQWSLVQDADTPQSRTTVPLYASMVAALSQALQKAAHVYSHEPLTYGRLLANVFEKTSDFTWQRAVLEYEKVYTMAARK